MTQFKKPLLERPNPKDEAVRQASKIGEGYVRQPRYPTYNPVGQATLDGRVIGGELHFKPDKPKGKPVPIPNGGPDTAWPGKYPSEGE